MNRCMGVVVGGTLGLGACAGVALGQMWTLEEPVAPVLAAWEPVTGAQVGVVGVGNVEALFGGLAVSPQGVLYSIDGFNDPKPDRLVTIDPVTGQAGLVGETGQNWNFRSVALDPTTGTLWGMDDTRLFLIDRGTGRATLHRTLWSAQPGLNQMTALAVAPSGAMYATDTTGTGLYRVYPDTGEAVLIVELGENTNWYADLAFDGTGRLWGVRKKGGIYQIDPVRGQETLVREGVFSGVGFAPGCYADCDGSGVLDLFDFLCFQNRFAVGEGSTDCDGSGVLDLFDLICFTNRFVAGCG